MKKIFSIVTMALIFTLGIIFVGCGENDGSLLLSFSTDIINITTGSEGEEYTIEVSGNSGGRTLSFDYHFAESYAKIDGEVRALGSNKYSVTIVPVSEGETTLTITLKGTQEVLVIPVVVSQQINGFTANGNAFVRRGDSLTITSANFNFNTNTMQKGLTYELVDAQTLQAMGVTLSGNVLSVDDDKSKGVSSISVRATSVANSEYFAILTVKVVDEIDLSSLKIEYFDYSAEDASFKASSQALYLSDRWYHDGEIELTLNDKDNFQKLVQVDYDFDGDGDTTYKIDVRATGEIYGDITPITSIVGKDDLFNFAIQATEATATDMPYTLKFRIYQADFEQNEKEISVSVKAKADPKEIRINGSNAEVSASLYHNSNQTYSYKFATYPSIVGAYNEAFYHYSISIDNPNWSDYITATYAGVSLDSSDASFDDLTSLSGSLEITPKVIDGEYPNMKITVKCLADDNSEVCSNKIILTVHRGTSVFSIDPTYTNATIFVAMPNNFGVDAENIFEGFTYTSGTMVGTLSFMLLGNASSVCDIYQRTNFEDWEQNPSIVIVPKMVGSSTFVISTENRLQAELTVVVVREMDTSNFSLQVLDDETNSISYYETDSDKNNTIKRIALKGVGSYALVGEVLVNTNYRDYDSNSYNYTLSLSRDEYFTITKTNDKYKIITTKFSEGAEILVYVGLEIYKVTDFKLELKYSSNDYFAFQMECIDYIKNLNITASNNPNIDGDSSSKVKTISVYNRNELSYKNQDLSVAYIYLDLQMSNAKKTLEDAGFTVSVEDNWEISVDVSNISGVYRVGSIGYFELGGEDDLFIAKFICNISGLNTISSFTIKFKLTDETGKTYTSQVAIDIDSYVDVDGLYIVGGRDTLYLDNTEDYRTVTLVYYVMPSDAMLQDVYVVIEQSTSGATCLTYQISNNTITFNYVAGGAGKIRIFPISKMKTDSIYDNYGDYYYNVSIDFKCADGDTEETALKISSYSDLLNIKSNKHYYIDSIIDCGGETLYFESFSKTIRGTFLSKGEVGFENAVQLGEITNFVVEYSGKSNSGLFGTLENTAKIYNLTVRGSFADDWEIDKRDDGSYIGLLCGTNNGTINNVNVGTVGKFTSTFASQSDTEIHIGLVSGLNRGEILVSNDAKNSTLMVDIKQEMTLKFNSHITAYVGGAVGYNYEGAGIKNTYTVGTYASIGLFGINANVNISATDTGNYTYLGGLVGLNGGNIETIKLVGQLLAGSTNSTTSSVGGMIGYSVTTGEVKNNISRAFVRGYGIVCGLIGKVENAGAIAGNKVQATDDGTREGLNASLIVAYGSTAFNVFDGNYELGSNIAETYFTRAVSSETSVSPNLPISSYYGDIVKTSDNNGTYISTSDTFTAGVDQVINSANIVSLLALAVYRQAKYTEDQAKIDNDILAQDLLELLNVGASELTISADNSYLMIFKNYGSLIHFGGTGFVTITLSSSLNYTNKASAGVYVTNYFDGVKFYDDKDLITPLTSAKVVNSKTKIIYFDCYADIYNYQNTPIHLVSNKDVTFDCELSDDIADIIVSGQTIYLLSKAKTGDSMLTLYPTIEVNGLDFYATYNSKLKAYVFITQEKSNAVESIMRKVEATTGIENIRPDKPQIFAEPSDTIQITVYYDSYNADDVLNVVPYLTINGETNKLEYSGSKIWDSSGEYFKLIRGTDVQLDDGSYKVTYVLSMMINKNNYNNLKNCTLKLEFYSKNTDESANVLVSYSPETITNVLINNYTKEDNKDMIASGYYVDSGMTSSGGYGAIGEMGVIKTYIYTQLSEFDYVEISMNSGKSGGYLAYAEQGIDENGDVIYRISSNVVYTSVDGVITLRLYRADIIANITSRDIDIYSGDENTLCIVLVYSLPYDITEGTNVDFTYYFFKISNGNAENIHTAEKRILARSTNKVEFSIYNKSAEQTDETSGNVNAVYKVAKGNMYPLELNVVGFEENEIFFETTNANVANIVKDGDIYYLVISNSSVDYGDKPYFTVKITSYGMKEDSRSTTRSADFVVELHIYDVMLGSELFDDTTLYLKQLSQTNIKELISNKINLEYNTDSNRKKFINSFINYAQFSIVDSNGVFEFKDGAYRQNDYYILNGNSLKPLIIEDDLPYTLRVYFNYSYVNGMPTCNIAEFIDGESIQTKTVQFTITVYMSTSEDIPAPISNYDELKQVKDGEYYRLISDIEIVADEFEMISATPAMLDGNGYSINILGSSIGSNLENLSNFALFEEVAEGSVFKNIRIVIKNRSTMTISNAMIGSANIGLLVATNNGVITNCEIVSDYILTINVISNTSAMENTYIGLIAGVNNGYLTNSRVMANVTVSGASLGGLVAINNGKIVSSYVKGARISNVTTSSSERITTGGFVCENNGSISMSYIEGLQGHEKIYCDYTNNDLGVNSKIIYTSTLVGGFVYKNTGEIYDCYSNIPVVSSSPCAGFVGINDGSIKRVYSLSKMTPRDTLNYAFVTSYNGMFEDCFFVIVRGVINYNTSETNYEQDGAGFKAKIEGVEPISLTDFNVSASDMGQFKSFLSTYDYTNPTYGVWFYVNDNTENVSGFETYDYDTKLFTSTKFVAGRLQLVAPNIISYSRYDFNLASGKKMSDGDYYYLETDSQISLGTAHNPYLITSADSLEDYANQRNSRSLEHYRLICDIDYIDDEVYNTELNNKVLVAYFEGNNMAIENYTVNSRFSYAYGGLFGQVGHTSSAMSTVKNLTLIPNYINLPNCSYVGALAGVIANANVFNVDIYGNDVVVVGGNIVGGVAGRTTGITYFKNVTSNVVAKSNKYNSTIIQNRNDMNVIANNVAFSENGAIKSNVSYGGGLVGYLGGESHLSHCFVGDDVKSFAVVAGLLFGGIGAFANVFDIDITLNSYNNEIRAQAFGGIVAGDLRGEINNITINSDILHKTLFSVYPITPIAIGGVAGVMYGGTINGLTSTSGYSVIGMAFRGVYGYGGNDGLKDGCAFDNINTPYIVSCVGGVVGYVSGKVVINNINIGDYDKDLGLIVSGGNYVGGVAGYLNGTLAFSGDININLTSHKKYVNANGDTLNEFIYTSYVSEANVHRVGGLMFNEDRYFGFVVGYKTQYYSSLTGSVYGPQITTSTALYLYYADYEIEEAKVPGNNQKRVIGNFSSAVPGDAWIAQDCSLVYETYNIATATSY